MFENEYIELPPNVPEIDTGTLKKAESAPRENWFEAIKRLELPEFILKVPAEVNVIEVLAVSVVVTPEKLTFPVVLWMFKFSPDIISRRSPGTTNLNP